MDIRSIRLSIITVLLGFSVCACNDKYGDDLRAIGSRVEDLESIVIQANNDIQSLSAIIKTVEQNGYATKVIENEDGSYTIVFNDGSEITLRDGTDGKDGKNGKDGKGHDFTMGVKQYSDGEWYWTVNGQWLLDDQGFLVKASATDGKDGKDDIGRTDLVPKVRINPMTNLWEISTDGGKTWINTEVKGNGEDGQDGRIDIFKNVKLSDDGTYLTVTLVDGSTFDIPVTGVVTD